MLLWVQIYLVVGNTDSCQLKERTNSQSAQPDSPKDGSHSLDTHPAQKDYEQLSALRVVMFKLR